MKTKRKVLVAILSLALAVSFIGCSAKSPDSPVPSDTSPTDAATPNTGEKMEITVAIADGAVQADIQNAVAAYNETNTDNAEIVLLGAAGDDHYTVMQGYFASDPTTAPVIFQMYGPDAGMFEDFYADISDTKAAGMMNDMFKEQLMIDSKLGGLATAVQGYGFVYNKDMFAAAGIDAESLTNMDSFVAALETLSQQEGVVSPLAFSQETYFIFIHFFNWALAVDPDYKADVEKLNNGDITMAEIPSVQQWAKDLDAIMPYSNKALCSYDDLVAGFANGEYAMIHQGDWVQSMLDESGVDFAYGMLPYPTSGNTSICSGQASAWRVNNQRTEAEQKAAKNFLDWLITSDEGQKYSAEDLNNIPAYKGVQSPSGALAQEVSSYISQEKTIPWVYFADFPQGIDVDGSSAMQKYYAGKINSDELLDELTNIWYDCAN